MAIVNLRGVLLTGAVPTDGSEPLTPGVQPVMWPQGQDGSLALAIVDPAGVKVNIAGSSIKFAMRARATDAPVLEISGSVTDAANGLASIAIAAENTSGLATDIYRFDVWLSLAGARSQIVPPSNFSVQAAELPPADGP